MNSVLKQLEAMNKTLQSLNKRRFVDVDKVAAEQEFIDYKKKVDNFMLVNKPVIETYIHKHETKRVAAKRTKLQNKTLKEFFDV